MDSVDRAFQLVMSEKAHADSQIDSYMGWQLKILGIVFVALAGAAGWIFGREATDPLTGDQLAAICLIGSVVLSVTLLQTALSYGVALVYMHYKNTVLAGQLAVLDIANDTRLRAVESWVATPARRPVMFATVSMLVATSVCSFSLAIAPWFTTDKWVIRAASSGTMLLWITSFVALAWTARAMRQVGVTPSLRAA